MCNKWVTVPWKELIGAPSRGIPLLADCPGQKENFDRRRGREGGRDRILVLQPHPTHPTRQRWSLPLKPHFRFPVPAPTLFLSLLLWISVSHVWSPCWTGPTSPPPPSSRSLSVFLSSLSPVPTRLFHRYSIFF